MISRKSKYALKAAIFLARNLEQGAILISDIAREEKIPKKFLESILLTLKNHGLLQSRKGKGGGYLLARSPERISVGEILRILDGPVAPVPCVSVTAYGKCEECSSENTCGIRPVMRQVRDAISSILDQTSLEDVISGMSGSTPLRQSET